MAGKSVLTHWWILTILTAFAAGWALGPEDFSAETATGPASGLKTKSSRQRASPDRSNPSARLVADLFEEMDAAASPGSVTPAADRAAAGRAAIDAWANDGRDKLLLAEARIRFAHWLESDPKAALTYWDSLSNREPLEELAVVAQEHFLTIDPGELVDWFAGNPDLPKGAATHALIVVLAEACAGEKNITLVERASAVMEAPAARYLLIKTIEGWPADDLKSLEEYVRKNPDPDVVRKYISRLNPTQMVPWIRSEMETNGSLAETLKGQGMVENAMISAKGVSIKERMALLEEIAAKGGNVRWTDFLPSTFVQLDVSNWLSRTDAEAGPLSDWRHRLRLGEINASQIMDEARRALPGAAAEQPDEFRDRLFNSLVSINPTSAMELVSQLPPPQRELVMMRSGMNLAGQADPQHLLELVSTMPPTRATPANDRFQIWSRATAPSYAKYGESYVSWVAAMPPGIERDWALSGLVGHFQALDPEKSAYLKSLKTLPDGWQPDP